MCTKYCANKMLTIYLLNMSVIDIVENTIAYMVLGEVGRMPVSELKKYLSIELLVWTRTRIK